MAATNKDIIQYSMDFMWLYKEFHSKHYASTVRSDTGWKPEFYQNKHERAIKKTISLINKLNKENFLELSKHFHSLYITSPESLDKMILELYRKALLDKGYISLYIRLAMSLGDIIKSEKPVKLMNTYALDSFKNEDRHINRLDNIKFIAELTNLEIIKTTFIIRNIIPELLKSSKLEELCMLIDTAFTFLEKFLKGKLNDILEQMISKVESNKIKFLVQDLQDKLKKKENKPRWGKQNQNRFSSSRKHTTFEQKNKKNFPLKNRSNKPWRPQNVRLKQTEKINSGCTINVEKQNEVDKRTINLVKETLLEYHDTEDKEEVITCFEEIKNKGTTNIPFLSFKIILNQKMIIQKNLNNLMQQLFKEKYFEKLELVNCITNLENEIDEIVEEYPLAPKLLNDWKSIQIE